MGSRIFASLVFALLCLSVALPANAETTASASQRSDLATDAWIYQNPCHYPASREDSALCADWISARSSQIAADWMPLQIAAIALSLIFSALAVIYTARSFSAFRSSERAHFEISDMQAGNMFHNGEREAVAFSITNTGRTPGWITGGSIAIHLAKTLPKKWKIPSTSSNSLPRHYIGPGDKKRFGEYIDLTKEQLIEVLNGDVILFLVIMVKYKDIFGKAHVSQITANFVKHGAKDGGDIFLTVNDSRHWRFT